MLQKKSCATEGPGPRHVRLEVFVVRIQESHSVRDDPVSLGDCVIADDLEFRLELFFLSEEVGRDLLGCVRIDPAELVNEPGGDIAAALRAFERGTGRRAGLPPTALACGVGAIATRAKGGIGLGVLLEADRALHLKDSVPEACQCETVCRLSFIYICPASLAVLFLTRSQRSRISTSRLASAIAVSFRVVDA